MSKKKDIFAKDNLARKINIPGQDDMIKERLDIANNDLGIKDSVISLDPKDLDTWILRDRADFELGDLDALAISIKNKGQAQPIIVVKKNDTFQPKSNSECRYIVIAGYRRWRACLNHNLQIETVIKNLTFDQAVECLEAENEKENVSEYSKGLFYSKLKNDYGYTLDKLSKQLGVAVSKLNRYITFSKVPEELWKAVKDMSLVSSRTSSEILEIINSDIESVKFFISIADKIAKGYGHTRIRKLYNFWSEPYNKKVTVTKPIKLSKNDIRINFNVLDLSEETKTDLVEKINTIVSQYQ
jgi:ParB family chromosome partitioning protein